MWPPHNIKVTHTQSGDEGGGGDGSMGGLVHWGEGSTHIPKIVAYWINTWCAYACGFMTVVCTGNWCTCGGQKLG